MANSMQLALDRALVAAEGDDTAAPLSTAVRRRVPRVAVTRPAEAGSNGDTGQESWRRPSRADKRLIAGHFDPAVARQLRIIAAEGDTTVQALLEEAIDLLLAKRARSSLLR